MQALCLCRGLKMHGILPLAVAPRASLFEERARAAGITVFPLSSGKPYDVRSCLTIRGVLKREKPQLVHCHTSAAHSLALLSTFLPPTLPIIVSRRVDFSVGNNPLSRWKYFHPRVHYIAISEGVKNILLSAGVQEDKIDLVYSGIDPERFGDPARSRKEVLDEFRVPDTAYVIGNVAALTDHKGQQYLVESANQVIERIPNAYFIIVGEGEERRNLESRVEQSGLRDRIMLPGFRKDINELMRAFDLFVLSSHLEGLCTSILDAMSLGIPVVATRTGGIPEVVKDGETGVLAEPKNPDSLAKAIIFAHDHPEALRDYAQKARERVLNEFTVDRMVERTIKVYTSTLEYWGRPDIS